MFGRSPLLLGVAWLLALALLAPPARAACPFAGLVDGEKDLPVFPRRRRMLQMPPPKQPPLPPPPCNIAQLSASPYNPPGPATQGPVDLKAAWDIITRGAGGAPGIGSPGAPNTSMPLGALLRLAFHDAGTYSRAKGTGGANGSFRFEATPALGANRAIQDAARACDRWRTQVNKRLAADSTVPRGTAISYADMYQLAGAAAVVVTGGPSAAQIWDVLPVGRLDSPPVGATGPPDNTTVLPAANLAWGGLACLFLGNGYTLAELVALSGAHTIGFRQRPGPTPQQPIIEPMTATPYSFDTDYFGKVLAGTAAFRTDNELSRQPTTLQLVTRWSTDQASFFSAFASAYIKMSKMGAAWRSYG